MLSLYPTTGTVKGILYDTFITDYSPLKSRKKPDHNQEKKIVPVYEKTVLKLSSEKRNLMLIYLYESGIYLTGSLKGFLYS